MDRPARFRVLIVDNEEYVHGKAEQSLPPLGEEIEIRSAGSVEESKKLIATEFFHLAFVDLELGAENGITVIRRLKVYASACRIVVMTKHLSDRDRAGEVLGLLGPSFSLAGVVNKVEGDVDWFCPFAKPLFTQWRQRLLDTEGLDQVTAAVLAKASRTDQQLAASIDTELKVRRDRGALGDEIRHILMGVFGSVGQPVAGSRSALTLQLLTRGFSASVVAEGVPSLRLAASPSDVVVQGNRCAVKIGAKTEIRREFERYEQIVKYGLALDHRVELLGYAAGDALAAVCYSFAGGGNTQSLRTLDDLIADESSEAWQDVVRGIFAADASNWYSIRSEVRALRTWFDEELGVPLGRCYDALDRWVDRLARLDVVRRDRQRLRIGRNIVIPLPSLQLLASGGLTEIVPACLAHGDLHGGNIMVDNRGGAYFIDFRNSGVAPRLIDFAALQATARFAHVERFRRRPDGWPKDFDVALVEQLAASFHQEERVVSGTGGPATAPAAGDARRGRRDQERWISVVAELENARVANFPDSDRVEALWTNFAYCLSMFRFTQMEWYRKLRMLTWLGAMTQSLRKL